MALAVVGCHKDNPEANTPPASNDTGVSNNSNAVDLVPPANVANTATTAPSDNTANTATTETATTGPVTSAPTTADSLPHFAVDNGAANSASNGSSNVAVDNSASNEPTHHSDLGSDTGESKTYVVKAGDNFWTIAKQVYGDATKATLIQKANPSVDPNALKINTKLTIPPLPSGSGSTGDSSTVVHAPDGSAGETYTIVSGDTLWTIAKKHYHDATKSKLIEQANPEIKNGQIHVGQKITLPPDTGSDSSTTTRPSHHHATPPATPPSDTTPSNRPDFG